MSVYILEKHKTSVSRAGARGVRGPAWSRAVPNGEPSVSISVLPRCAMPALLHLRTPKPERLCAPEQSALANGQGKGEESACFPCHLLPCSAALWQM